MLTLEQLLEQTAVKTDEFLKPKEGKKENLPQDWKPENALTNARMVSFPFKGQNVPFAEVHVHYAKNKQKKVIAVFLCLKKMEGKDCPMCDFGWSEYNAAKAANIKNDTFKRFLPSKEYVSLIIERETEEADFHSVGYPVLKCFKFPNKVKDQIELLLKDPDYGDITHLIKGTDIKINFNKEAADSGNLSLTIQAARTSSPIFNKRFADASVDFETFREVYTKMLENKCDPFGRFERLDQNGIFEVLKKMRDETSDKEEVEQNATENSNVSEEAKMLALQKELAQA